MSTSFTDLRSLYRAAQREAMPMRADQRAVRKAMLSAGIASSALHAATASGKLISLIPGGAKVFTVGQVVAYACLGAAMGGALAVAGVATARYEVAVDTASTPVGQRQTTLAKRVAPQSPPVSSIEESVRQQKRASPAPSAVLKSASSIGGIKQARPSASPTEPSAQQAVPLPAVVPSARPSIAPQPPSLAEESRELGAVQAALGAKDASRALQLLDTQDRLFHGGNLTQERAAARVIALCIAGRVSEADLAKSRFVTAYPGSPWLRRIAVACTKMESNK